MSPAPMVPDEVLRHAEDQVVLGWVTGTLVKHEATPSAMVKVIEVQGDHTTLVETTGVLARPGIRYRVQVERVDS